MFRLLVLGHLLVLAGCGCSTTVNKGDVACARASGEWVVQQKAYAMCNAKIGCVTNGDFMVQMIKSENRMTAACTKS